MRWLQSEYVLKGVFLGLWLFVALQAPDWSGVGQVSLSMAGGLLAALVLGVLDQIRRGQKLRGNKIGYLLFLLLEYPMLIYAGLVFGLAGGAISIRNTALPKELLLWTVGGGAIFGFILSQLLLLKNREYRTYALIAATAASIGGVVYFLNEQEFFALDRFTLGLQLLVGLPFFYLLVFSGVAEESEVEIALICAGLGVSTYLMQFPKQLPAAGFLIPVTLFFVYSTRILPGLRVFKHVLRGHSYLSMGRTKMALMSFRRSLQLDPKSPLAKSGMWQLHLGLDLNQIHNDPEVLELLDLQMCLNRAADLVMGDRSPTPAQRDEVRRLLELVEHERPKLKAEVLFYRAVAATHSKNLGDASELLTEVLDPSYWSESDPSRKRILLKAWMLALEWHPGLKAKVGEVQINLPGRRMEAIRAIERFMAGKEPDQIDEPTKHLRSVLYSELQEDEYFATAREAPPSDFNHDYVEQLGHALLGNGDQWQRGAGYLRMAAKGLLFRGPTIFQAIALAYERVGDIPAVKNYLQQVIRAGMSMGVGKMDAQQKEVYFATVKRLADEAEKSGDLDTAIANWNLLTQSESCGIETFRKLADLYERNGDVLAALRLNETALAYNGKDADLLSRKERYYNSIEPEQLKLLAEEVRPYFDVDYCKRKSRQLLEFRNIEQDSLEWAERLARLAQVMQPKNLSVMALVSRCLLRFGDRDAALHLLEDVREGKPSGGEEEDAWYWTCQTLGRIYLDELSRPDLAIHALLDFKKSNKSGADTIYHLGRAYEATENFVKAQQCYEQVTAYEGHPLARDAYDALYRVKNR